MLKTAFALVVACLAGCAALPSYDEGRFTNESLRQAYVMGSAHAGLAYCSAHLDRPALELHKTAALRAALAQGGARPEQLREAFEAGLRDGGGFSSPHRTPCSEAAAVLNCSLEDYLVQWRAGEPGPK